MGVKLIVCEDSVMKVLVRPTQVTIEKSPYHPASSVHPIAPAFSQSYPSSQREREPKGENRTKNALPQRGRSGASAAPVFTIFALAARDHCAGRGEDAH